VAYPGGATAVAAPPSPANVNSLSFAGFARQGPVCRPLVGAKLTDTFGAARSGGRKHEGIDIFAAEGTPIHAVAGGTVVQGFTNGLGGNVVRIQGDDGRFYYYAHLTGGSTDHLKVGQHVNAGQVIGGVGHTGDAAGTPNHLHFQVRENGQWVNPFNFLQPLPDLTGAGGAAALAAPTDPFAIDPGGPPSVTDADGDGLIDQFEQLFGTDTTKADTDGDGLSDAYETSVSHTDPLSMDTDRDGLTDAHELATGSDPGRGAVPDSVRAARFGGLATLDSDNDGVSDLQEQKAGTNALDADTDHDGLSDGVEAAHGSNPLSIDSDSDGLTDSFESASGTLEPMAQAGVPGGAALAPGGFGAAGGLGGAGGLGAGSAAALGTDPLAGGAPGTGTDDLAAVDPYGH
jgi:peptidase M23-like protein/thrombospondin type 3 repeat protein